MRKKKWDTAILGKGHKRSHKYLHYLALIQNSFSKENTWLGGMASSHWDGFLLFPWLGVKFYMCHSEEFEVVPY